MREMEGTEAGAFAQLFRYKMKEKAGDRQECKAVAREYRLSALDPARKAATTRRRRPAKGKGKMPPIP